MASLETLQSWLTEAEAARHKLLTGAQTAEVKKPDGGSVKFTPATKSDLETYILDLKAQVAKASGVFARRPIGALF